MQELITAIGYGLCHQLPQRTMVAGGWRFPVCARDTGMYLAMLATIITLLLLNRFSCADPVVPPIPRPRDTPVSNMRIRVVPPSAPAIVLVAACLGAFAFDGVTSYMGLRATTNMVRFGTGTAAGIAAGMLLYWILHTLAHPSARERILSRPRDLAIWILVPLVFSGVFFSVYPYAGLVGPLLTAIAIVAVFFGINTAAIALARRMVPLPRRGWCLRLALPALCASAAELAVLGMLRHLLA